MSDRRMFAKAIISSGRFLKMPPTARLLYYDLGMHADDDGVVEAYAVMAQTKATEDDLRILMAKGYVKVLNDELVSLICDWNTNNMIRADRYHESIYKDLLIQMKVQPNDNQMATKCQPNDNQMATEVSIGKVSKGKDRLGEDKKSKAPVFFPDDPLIEEALQNFIAMRKKIKAPMTDKAIELAIKKLTELAAGDKVAMVKILEQSTMNSWKGLFPLKEEKKPAQNSTAKSLVDEWMDA